MLVCLCANVCALVYLRACALVCALLCACMCVFMCRFVRRVAFAVRPSRLVLPTPFHLPPTHAPTHACIHAPAQAATHIHLDEIADNVKVLHVQQPSLGTSTSLAALHPSR